MHIRERKILWNYLIHAQQNKMNKIASLYSKCEEEEREQLMSFDCKIRNKKLYVSLGKRSVTRLSKVRI